MSRLPGFIIVALIIALIVRISFVFYIVYVFAGIYVLSHLWIRRAISNVSISRKLESRVFQGEKADLSLDVINNGFLPVPWLRLRELLPASLAFPPSETWLFGLAPKARATVNYSVVGRRRGFYTIGPLLGQAGDVFGVEEVHYRAQDVANLTVYPKVKTIAELGLPSRSPFGDLRSRQRIYEDPARIAGVRDYVTGDSLRRVNWKVSAKAAKLQVKKYDPAISQELAIFLDLSESSYDSRNLDYASELAVVTAASVAAHMLGVRQSVGLTCNGSLALMGGDRVDTPGTVLSIDSGRGHGHLMQILTGLARVELTKRDDFPDLLRRKVHLLPWGSTVVVVSGHDSPEMVTALLQLRRAGFNVVVIVVQRPSARRQRLAEAVASHVFRIWIEEELGGLRSVA